MTAICRDSGADCARPLPKPESTEPGSIPLPRLTKVCSTYWSGHFWLSVGMLKTPGRIGAHHWP